MGLIFRVVAILAGCLAAIVVALCLSAGLYFACDIAEEYGSVTKRWISAATISVIAIYVLLLIGGLPVINICIGIMAHISYLPLLNTFPLVEPISVATIWACMVSVGNHLNWFHFFVDQVKQGGSSAIDREDLSAFQVTGCIFLLVWLVPIGFFISLISADECLPTSSGLQSQYKKKQGIFKSFMNSFLKNRWHSDSDKHY